MKKNKLNTTFAQWYKKLLKERESMGVVDSYVILKGDIINDLSNLFHLMVLSEKPLFSELPKGLGYVGSENKFCKGYEMGVGHIDFGYCYKTSILVLNDNIFGDLSLGYETFDGEQEFYKSVFLMFVDLVTQMKQYYIDNNVGESL